MGEGGQFDVLIVGAGISGVDIAYRLKTRCASKSWLILEARDRIGGTWDLFRYPGVRSDSDMYTLGFPFRPWRSDLAIVEGDKIRDYVEETAREYDIDKRICFGRRVTRASWSSADQSWTLDVEAEGSSQRFTSRFLYLASGYYDYASGHRPHWPGEEDFGGRFVHPQFWPDDLDYSGKNVVVIGSGATAVTLVPAMAETAAHVTMLQRSPTYIVARPAKDAIARWSQRLLPARAADALVKWKNVLLSIFFFSRARAKPERVKAWIARQAKKELPAGYPIEPDFAPRYDPWDQRLCLVPDGDLFAAIRRGQVSIATGQIDRFTPDGIRLESGEEIAADLVFTATGLNMKLAGGIAIEVDGEPVELAERLIYKGMMIEGVPNLAIAFGYTNASWTLKSDLTARTFCRLINHMAREKRTMVTPRRDGAEVEPQPIIDFSSGYVKRAESLLPKQGDRPPWRVHQNYIRDLIAMRFRPVADEGLEFEPASNPGPARA